MSKNRTQAPPTVSAPVEPAAEKLKCSICKMDLPDSWKPGDACPACGNFGPGQRGISSKAEELMPEVSVLKVKDGDTLVIRSRLLPEELGGLFTSLQDHFSRQGKKDVRFLVLPPEGSIETADEESMRKAGWVRAEKS